MSTEMKSKTSYIDIVFFITVYAMNMMLVILYGRWKLRGRHTSTGADM